MTWACKTLQRRGWPRSEVLSWSLAQGGASNPICPLSGGLLGETRLVSTGVTELVWMPTSAGYTRFHKVELPSSPFGSIDTLVITKQSISSITRPWKSTASEQLESPDAPPPPPPSNAASIRSSQAEAKGVVPDTAHSAAMATCPSLPSLLVPASDRMGWAILGFITEKSEPRLQCA